MEAVGNRARIKTNIKIIGIGVGILWGIFLLAALFPGIREFGVLPREARGLLGVLFHPLLHGGPDHLIANSIALFVLLFLALTYSRELTLDVVVIAWVLSGVFIWIAGRGGVPHIGASGIVFGLIGFLIAAGFWRKDWRAIVLTILIFFLYGGAILSLLKVQEGISWAGHISGFGSGVLTAWITRKDSR